MLSTDNSFFFAKISNLKFIAPLNAKEKTCTATSLIERVIENLGAADIELTEEEFNNIEKEVYNSLAQEIDSKTIGEYVMQEIKKVDEVAYIRFASVYRRFADIDNFIELLNSIKKDK